MKTTNPDVHLCSQNHLIPSEEMRRHNLHKKSEWYETEINLKFTLKAIIPICSQYASTLPPVKVYKIK